MKQADIETTAAFLYDGGWRSDDRGELATKYNLTQDEADDICAELAKVENKNAR